MQHDLLRWKRFREGDTKAFESIVRGEFRALFSYGRRFVHDKDTLNDCIHDLFASLWDRREHLADTDHIRPYLFRSLRNRLLKEMERGNYFTSFDGQDEQPDLEEDVETKIISSETTEQRRRQITSVLGTLTPRQREIIHLKFFESLSHEQIADVLDISRPAVANLLSQALKLFRDKWQAIVSFVLSILFY